MFLFPRPVVVNHLSLDFQQPYTFLLLSIFHKSEATVYDTGVIFKTNIWIKQLEPTLISQANRKITVIEQLKSQDDSYRKESGK